MSALFLRSKNTVLSLGQQKTGGLPAKNEERGKKTLKTMIAENHSLSTRKAASIFSNVDCNSAARRSAS